jgi:hypothetical protein
VDPETATPFICTEPFSAQPQSVVAGSTAESWSSAVRDGRVLAGGATALTPVRPLAGGANALALPAASTTAVSRIVEYSIPRISTQSKIAEKAGKRPLWLCGLHKIKLACPFTQSSTSSLVSYRKWKINSMWLILVYWIISLLCKNLE